MSLRYLLFGSFLLLVVVNMHSCVTQQAPKELLTSEKIMRCIKRLGVNRSLKGRHKVCAEIFAEKE